MKIMVFDVPAISGGALSVLHDFYHEYKLDQANEYIFVVSLPELKKTTNINILRFPWIKKSWFHRLLFDHFFAPRLIKKYQVDKVLSLQNIIIPHIKVYQSVFVHNALPFSKYKFKLREEKFLWIYQNIIGRKIKKSIKKSDHVIVQTNWMKNKFIEQLNINSEKIEVKRPKIDIEIKEYFHESKESLSTFFYPASGAIFKNHRVIVDACLELKKSGIDLYNVIFTLNGNENRHIIELYNIVKESQLPIKFVGSLRKEEVFQLYSKSILIFPSYIETVGLPLIEALKHNSPIIATNSEYVFEVIENYDQAFLFKCFNYFELAHQMKEKIELSKGVSNGI